MTPDHAAAGFRDVFGESPTFVIRAPGRVNLIGDHTDYNDGLVLPIAIDRALYIAASPANDPIVEAHSDHYKESAALPLAADTSQPPDSWERYLFGVVALLLRRGLVLRGCRLWIGGDVPPGGGLSSSAALEVGSALALLGIARESISPNDLARLCQQAENDCAGSPCGIMDQLCCTSAKAGHALLIDCRNLATQAVRLRIKDARIVIVDTGVRHSIADGEYSTRRKQCASALTAIQRKHPSVRSLRDVDDTLLLSLRDLLDPTLLKRVKHGVTENARVAEAASALERGDLKTFGKLMRASHESLRDDYEVSCPELDEVVSIALSVDGVYGARMTGGGFGGFAVILVNEPAIPTLRQTLRKRYTTPHNRPPDMFVVQSADGAAIVSSPGQIGP